MSTSSPLPAIYIETIRSGCGASISPGGSGTTTTYLRIRTQRVTSCYQFLAAERRAWKFMRDATHCFNAAIKERRKGYARPCGSRRRRGEDWSILCYFNKVAFCLLFVKRAASRKISPGHAGRNWVLFFFPLSRSNETYRARGSWESSVKSSSSVETLETSRQCIELAKM